VFAHVVVSWMIHESGLEKQKQGWKKRIEGQ
jgi:hypothetical protein